MVCITVICDVTGTEMLRINAAYCIQQDTNLQVNEQRPLLPTQVPIENKIQNVTI